MTVCVSARISPERAIFTKFLCVLPTAVARSSGTLTIGHIAYRQNGGDRSAQLRRSVIYDSLVILFVW